MFVYAFDVNKSFKMETVNKLIKEVLLFEKGCICYQVFREFFNVARKKINNPFTLYPYQNTASAPFGEVDAGMGLLTSAPDIPYRWKYAFFDFLIISVAIYLNYRILYLEDLHYFQKKQDRKIKNHC